jgi:hypothetical protein
MAKLSAEAALVGSVDHGSQCVVFLHEPRKAFVLMIRGQSGQRPAYSAGAGTVTTYTR